MAPVLLTDEATRTTRETGAAPVEVIVNAAAGTQAATPEGETLAEVFRSHGLEARIRLARSGAEIVRLAEAAAANQETRVVVAGGGDGTINAVASHLVGTEKALGVLPLGTLNHFAKDLRIPLDLEGAVANIATGRVAAVDVGEVNGKIFINNASLGLYPSIVRRRERQQERLGRGKWPAFVWAAFSVLRLYPFMRVRLSADGQRFVRKTAFVFIGNNEYQMESLSVGGRSCLDAGHLSLYLTHRTGRFGLLILALRALIGRLREAKDFDSLCAKEIFVETRRPKRIRVATDGEVTVMRTPLHFRARPGGLRVIVPENSDG
ncbi:MAG TPA: diacylglycerol kinase family protein [Pyrinomonadaceae bacterium]|nr:diacylglycerol kinase family protein [Pyrinomonadaceae bacterium]